MSNLFDNLDQRRAIIDRRDLAARLDAIAAESSDSGTRRRAMVDLLKGALEAGRAEIERRLLERPSSGRVAANATAFLIDQIVRLSHDFTTGHLYPSANRSAGERITLIAVGGYGRGEMAPHSDIDIGFLTPFKQTSWTEQVIEAQLYTLWDLGLKVGHSSRSLDEMVRAAKEDLTVRTALLEGRFIWGDRDLYDQASARFDAEVVAGNARSFVAEKLAERDERHKRMGDSRYVVEPNVKEGKGGLRDLHALFWIDKLGHGAHAVDELADPEERVEVAQPALAFLHIGLDDIARIAHAPVPLVAFGELLGDESPCVTRDDLGVEARRRLVIQIAVAPDEAPFEQRGADRQILLRRAHHLV